MSGQPNTRHVAFLAALQAKGVPVKMGKSAKELAHQGFVNAQSGKKPLHQESADYMRSYSAFEPLLVTRTVSGKTLFSIADVTYLSGFDEWHYSPYDAIKYSYLSSRDCYLARTEIVRIAESRVTFDERVDADKLIKTDVARQYQLDIEGNMLCSIDGGKTYWQGGIMDYPLIPDIGYFETDVKPVGGGRKEMKSYRKPSPNELQHGSLTKLKADIKPNPYSQDYSRYHTRQPLDVYANYQRT